MNSESDNAADHISKADAAPPVPGGGADPDLACVRRAQDGDRRATEELVLRHQAAVSRLLWRFVRTQTDLDDLVQETFLRMVRGLSGWRANQPFEHWLLRIATNAGRDYFRRQAVRRRWTADTPGDAEGRPLIPDLADPSPDPAARAAAEEVKTMLARLSPDERALLTLHHLEGWDLGRIAAQFGWTSTATKLRAWRARRHLRSLYESQTP